MEHLKCLLSDVNMTNDVPVTKPCQTDDCSKTKMELSCVSTELEAEEMRRKFLTDKEHTHTHTGHMLCCVIRLHKCPCPLSFTEEED